MKLSRLLDKRIEAVTVEYPGRVSREDDLFIDVYDDFLTDVVTFIEKRRNSLLPYAVLGYSFGSVLAFDICSKQLVDGKLLYAFFCAEGSLLKDNPARRLGELSHEEFSDKVIQLGGMDEKMLNNSPVLDKYLLRIKHDYNILAQFRYSNQIVPCNATIMYSPQDLTCINMEDWAEIVSGRTEFYSIGDNHFFINQNFRDVAKIINDNLSVFM